MGGSRTSTALRRRSAIIVAAAFVVGLLVSSAGLGSTARAASGTSPSQQMLLGAAPQGSGNDRWQGLLDFESTIGRRLDYVRVFELWNSTYPTTFHTNLTSSDRIMLLSVRARRTNGTVIPWKDIATMAPGSTLQKELDAWVDRLKAIGKPVWFTFNHEPEIAANTANGTDADYIAAWRRVVQEFRDRGATNVKFVWIVTGYSFELPSTDRRYAPKWYPGDAYVDYLADDTYNWSTCRAGVYNPWRTFASVPAGLTAFGALHPDKRLLLSEWASAEQGGDKAAWIDDARSLMKQPAYSQFLGLSYFNKVDGTFPSCQWPISSSAAATAAFVRLAQDPFFGGPGTGTTPTAPQVKVSAPTAGSTVSGTVPVQVAVTAGDADPVRVDFTAGGKALASDVDGSNGWSTTWDTTAAANGATTVTATVTDAGGLTGTASVPVSVSNTAPPAVVMVVASPTALTTGEQAVRSRLVGLGDSVTLLDDDSVTATSANGADLVLVSQSVTRPAAATALKAATATVWVAKPYLFDELGMTGTSSTTDYGSVATTTLSVSAAAHPMAAGRTGTVSFLSPKDAVSWGRPGAAATVVAQVGSQAAMFAYPRAATLADGTSAAGCRLSFPLYGTAPTRHTSDAWAMFDATAKWGAGGC